MKKFVTTFIYLFKPFFTWASVGLGIILACLLLLAYFDSRYPEPNIDEIDWGITFSEKMSRDFGLDWQANYTAILDDLKPQGIRLVAYWDLIEPQPDTWDFANLDWQVEEAAKRNIPVIISVGQKVPRWPECHYPTWIDRHNQNQRETELIKYIETVVTRYKDKPNLAYWQIENEPFLKLTVINCPKTSYKFVQSEVELARTIDPHHKIIVTDSGQVGTWYKAARIGDVLGITNYLYVNNPFIGTYRYPYLPGRRTLSQLISGKNPLPFMIVEQQGEPWADKQIYEFSVDDQKRQFTLQDLRDSIQAGRNRGATTQYIWGVEWWYSLKVNNSPEYWNLFKSHAAARRGEYRLNEGFLWGASTASHQIEGNTTNDWSEWEKVNAERLAAESVTKKDSYPAWDKVASEATDPKNYISGMATDHYTRYPEDFRLAQSLGMNAQRISLEWSRIEPREGEYDEVELKHYQDVIRDMKSKGMEPFVTLWHYTIPVWFRDKGGWESPEAVDDYVNYSKKVASYLGDDVTYWITMNEPGIYTSNAYLLGHRPPQKRSPLAYLKVLHTLKDTHLNAFTAIKSVDPTARVGFAHDAYSFQATSKNPLLESATIKLMRWWRNHYFLNQIRNHQDFIGLNYYIDIPVGFGPKRDDIAMSDLGWRLNPAGLRQTLHDLARYDTPIYITENGLADASDTQRAMYIQNIVKEISTAQLEGVDVRGYFHWSLIDNFEWEKGKWPRFGLIEVNYENFSRHLRSSADTYRKIIKDNGVLH